jgi:hypothetical protein
VWLNNFCKTLFATSTRRRPTRRTASRLCLEALEDRTVPAFLAPVSFPGGGGEAMVSADFNRDGWLDLASPGGVLLGNGHGTFQPALSLPYAGGSWAMAVGDFNGDGNPDLAGPTSVLLGNGDGPFGQPIEFYGWAWDLAVGDFNGDGNADLVRTWWENDETWGTSYIGVLLGNGDGTFTPHWSAETIWIATIALADFNADGMLDVAVNDYGNVGVWLGNGDGTLQPPIVSDVPGPGYVTVADFDGDGKPDLVTLTDEYVSANLSILLGDGDGTFQPAQVYQASTSGLAVGDFNGDGKADVAVARDDSQGGSVLVFLGNGDGTLGLPASFHTGFAWGVTAADFNGDGFSDLAGTTNSAVKVLVNDANWPPVGAPSVSISDVTVTEGNSGTRTANFLVSLSAPYSQEVTVNFATADGTATAGSDYQAVMDTLTFAPGETSKTITVLVNGDRLAEPNETFFVNLSGAANATIADSQGVGTIVDDEPRISINNVSQVEGNSGTTVFRFTVALSAIYDQDVTVFFQTFDGTATAGSDYQAQSGWLTFKAGETVAYIDVIVYGDMTHEPDETFYVQLSGASDNAWIEDDLALGFILNDDAEPTKPGNNKGGKKK